MTVAEAQDVFISYRRAVTAMHAGRLYDGVAAAFGEEAVFMDLEMEPGVDFVERIVREVSACRALLVVIGPQWAEGGATAGRLADPKDFVRLEVETGLGAPGVMVIPVLVAGARMPAAEELPPELRAIVRRNAIELTDLKWRYDCARLISALERLLGEPEPEPEPEPAQSPRPARIPRRERTRRQPSATSRSAALAGASVRALLPLWLEGVVVAVLAGMLTRTIFDPQVNPNARAVAHLIPLVERRAATWAVIGVVLALWMCLRRGEYERLAWRAVTGLVLGALGGALGGAVYGVLVFVVSPPLVHPETAAVLSLAVTGSLVGATVGGLWIPRRVLVGFVSGAVGGMLSTLATNAFGHPADVPALGLDCFAIVGLALLAMMALDVRTATVSEPALAVPEAARA